MPASTAENVSVARLADFPRRNRKTGAPELLRVECSDFNGREYVNCRTWYQARPGGPNDDVWRPTSIGVTFRQSELAALPAAIEEARRIVHAVGRSTASN